MSRLYWLSVIALVGLTLTLSGSALSKPIRHNAGSSTAAAETQAKPQADPKPILSVATQNDIQRIARALEAANSKQPTADENKRADEDLKAQQDMAYWAFWMFLVGVVDTALTIVGVWLIYRTVIYTRDTAKAAEGSVSEAKRSADEAKRAADAAEKALAAQDRPHIVLREIPIGPIEAGPEPSKNHPKYGFQFENYGEDLAFLKAFRTWATVLPGTEQLPESITITPSNMHWPLPPGQAWGVDLDATTATLMLSEQQRDGILNGTKILYMVHSMDYTDSGGAKHAANSVHMYRLVDKKFVPFNDERHWKYT